jgi:ribosome-associated protein
MARDETSRHGPSTGDADPSGDLAVGFGVVIPGRELVERMSRSSGPGGQRTNKVATRVSLLWNVADSEALDEDRRARLRARLGTRLTARGELIVHAQTSREQTRNRVEARRRLASLVHDALAAPARPRRPTKPTKGSVERRLGEKRRRSDTKRRRRSSPRDDE